MMFFYNDIKYIIPEVYFFIFIFFLLLFGVYFSNSKVFRYNPMKSIYFLTSLIGIYLLILFINRIDYNYIISNSLLYSNNISTFFQIISILIFLLLTLISYDILKKDHFKVFEFYILLSISLFSLLILLVSNDFISVYFTIELQGLCFYVLSAYKREKNFSVEAGLKYFVLGSFASALFLYGVMLMYGLTGTTNFTILAELFFDGCFERDNILNYSWIPLFFIFSGLLFKASIAPYHFWFPDVLEGVPRLVAGIFALLPKGPILFLIYKLLSGVFIKDLLEWKEFFLLITILTMLIGTLNALYQTKLLRIFAYSSILHMGFLLFGCYSNSIESLILYLITYLLSNIIIFSILFTLNRKNNSVELTSISQLSYLHKSNPILANCFSISLFSLAGIPPLAGFYGKFYVLSLFIEEGLYGYCFLILLISSASCFYYLRLIKTMEFTNTTKWTFLNTPSFISSYFIVILTYLNLFFVIYMDLLLDFLHYIQH